MASPPKFDLTFEPSGRGAARCPPDPRYPDGVFLDVGNPGWRCHVELPYPAPECGMWLVRCRECGMSAAITAAGRADDPRGAMLPCLPSRDIADADATEPVGPRRQTRHRSLGAYLRWLGSSRAGLSGSPAAVSLRISWSSAGMSVRA
jgi:hypothetical protein